MSDTVSTRHGTRVLLCAPDGPALAGEQDTADLLGVAFSLQADLIALPVERLDARFFTLRTGVAGAIVGKIATYQRRLAVIGDISAHLAASTSFSDFVAETNRGRQVWFVAGLDELDARLAPAGN